MLREKLNAAARALGLALLVGGSVQAQVGMRQVQTGPFAVTLVYPTDTPSSMQALGPFNIDVALDAPPRAQRHRLVVLSHGTGGSAIADHSLAAKLARAGFVVAQPLHEGDNFRDQRLAGPESFRRRPAEVSRVVDMLAADPLWSARLALDKVGVHGMSAGGVSGLSLAGGQWRLVDLVRHCNDHAQEDEGFCFQGARDGSQRRQRQASYDRARYVPDLLLPDELTAVHGGRVPTPEQPDVRPDPRVASVSLAVPLAVIFTPDSLSRIRIPIGVVAAGRDEVLVPRHHSSRLLANCSSCTLLAQLDGAGHFDLLWPWPDSVAREVAGQQVRGGLPTPGFDGGLRDAAHEKIVAFHRQHLLPP